MYIEELFFVFNNGFILKDFFLSLFQVRILDSTDGRVYSTSIIHFIFVHLE